MNRRYGSLLALCLSSTLTLAAEAATIEARGLAGRGLAPPNGSNQVDSETGSPLTRTLVAVGDSGSAPTWDYFALADITTPRLQARVALDNSAGTSLVGEFGGELPLLRASATLSDRVFIDAPNEDPYLVEATLIVDGAISGLQADDLAFANVQLRIDPVDRLNQTASASFSENVALADFALPIAFQFSGDAEFDLDSSLFVSIFRASAGSNILVDFSNTAILFLTVTTLGGDPFEDVVITSESGNLGIRPIPLPTALPLLLSAVALLAARRRRAS